MGSPQEGWVFLNTDWFAKGNLGQTDGRGIFWEHRGCFVVAYMETYDCCPSRKDELLAFQKGLKMAWDLGVLN